MKIKCQYCGREFEDYPSNKRKFCSRKCYYNSGIHKIKTNSESLKRFYKIHGNIIGFPKGHKGFRDKESYIRLSKKLKGKYTAEKSWFWKGKKTKDQGYWWIYQPNHHKSHAGRVKQAILIMEKHINRSLRLGEIVHHIDKDRANDNIKNLSLFRNDSAHKRWHSFLKQFNLKNIEIHPENILFK